MDYDWDDAKNQSNIQKHGVSFEEAQTVFDDPQLLLHEDATSLDEQRFVAIGFSKLHRALFVVFCERSSCDQDDNESTNAESEEDEVIRLISARKLTPSERRRLEPLRLRQLTGAKC